MVVEFDIEPLGKPRMTQQDKWRTSPYHVDPKRRQRLPVTKYFAFKTELRLKANLLRFQLPDAFEIDFYIPMPPSWSKKRRTQMLGKPHQHKPDADNMAKAVMDCLREDDSGIWSLTIRKYWAESGRIVIRA